MGELRIVFDGPPSHEGGRFVEVEDASGKGIRAGEWRERPDKLWELVITALPSAADDQFVTRALYDGALAAGIAHAERAIAAEAKLADAARARAKEWRR